jgi:hypothetical protein
MNADSQRVDMEGQTKKERVRYLFQIVSVVALVLLVLYVLAA